MAGSKATVIVSPLVETSWKRFESGETRQGSLSTAPELIRSGHRVQSSSTSESYSSLIGGILPRLRGLFIPSSSGCQEVAMALTYFLGLSTTALLVVGLCTCGQS